MTYTEDSFVEQPAIKLFKSLDWQTLNCWDEVFGEESPLGCENRGDVILQNRVGDTHHMAHIGSDQVYSSLSIDS